MPWGLMPFMFNAFYCSTTITMLTSNVVGSYAVLVGQDKKSFGRLAQLVERYFDVVDVRGSTPLPPTKIALHGAPCRD